MEAILLMSSDEKSPDFPLDLPDNPSKEEECLITDKRRGSPTSHEDNCYHTDEAHHQLGGIKFPTFYLTFPHTTLEGDLNICYSLINVGSLGSILTVCNCG